MPYNPYPYSPAYQAAGYAVPSFAPAGGGMTQPQQASAPAANYGSLTPPTIHAEIIQVDSEAAVDTQPQAAGTSQMYMTRDDAAIIVKTQYANGGFDKVVYDRRPPAPPAPVFVPEEYVRKDEIGQIVAAALAGLKKEETA